MIERIQHMQRIATGQLGWTPKEFWCSTWLEVQSAIEGRIGRRINDLITAERAREVARHYPPTKSIRKRAE